MPKIPQFQADTRLRTGGASISPGAAGAVSQAVSGLATTVTSIATAAVNRQRDAEDAAFATEQSNSLSRRWTERQIELEQSGEDVDLEGLKKEYDDDVAATLKNAPSDRVSASLKRTFDNNFSNKVFPSMARHQAGRNVEKRVSSVNTALDDINSEVLTGRTDITEALARAESAIVGLEQTTGGVVDTAKLRESTRNDIGRNALSSLMESDPQEALSQMNAGDWDKFTSAEDLKFLRKSAKKNIADNASIAQKQQAASNALLASDLEISVNRNEATFKDIDDALKKGIITPAKRTQLVKSLDAESLKLRDEANILSKVRLSLGAGIPLDPTSTEDKEGVDLMWNELAPSYSELPADEFSAKAVDFIKQTNILPATLKGSIAAFSRSGDTGQAMQAADLVGRMVEEALPAVNDLTDETKAQSLMIMDQVRSGIAPGKAIENARTATFGLVESEKAVIREQSRIAAPDLKSSLDTFVDQTFDPSNIPFFGEEPDVTPAMLGEYRVSFDRFMQLTRGDIEQSQKLAFQGITKVWGVTEVGGESRFMKYAPESVYRIPGVDNQWMENQFNEEMALLGAEGAILATNSDVARSEKPAYPILVPNEDGLIEPFTDENNVGQTWQPDFKLTLEFEELNETPSPVEEAKKQRTFNQQRRQVHVKSMVETRVRGALPFEIRLDIESDRAREQAVNTVGNLLSAERINGQEAKQYLELRGLEFTEQMQAVIDKQKGGRAAKAQFRKEREAAAALARAEFVDVIGAPGRAIARTTKALQTLSKE